MHYDIDGMMGYGLEFGSEGSARFLDLFSSLSDLTNGESGFLCCVLKTEIVAPRLLISIRVSSLGLLYQLSF